MEHRIWVEAEFCFCLVSCELWVVTERFEKQRRKPSTLKFSCVRSAWIFGVYFLLLRYLAQIKISCCVRFNILRWDLILKLVKHTVLFLPFSLFIFFIFFISLQQKYFFIFYFISHLFLLSLLIFIYRISFILSIKHSNDEYYIFSWYFMNLLMLSIKHFYFVTMNLVWWRLGCGLIRAICTHSWFELSLGERLLQSLLRNG